MIIIHFYFVKEYLQFIDQVKNYITQTLTGKGKKINSKMSKKYFINNLNTPFGTALLNQLVKEQTQDPQHMCTMKDNLNIKPNGIKKILKREKPKLFAKKATQECEVYVYNIDQTDLQDVQFGLEMMKKPFEDNKTFIFVSDIMVWSKTQRKIKKDAPLPVNEENAEQGEEKKEQEVKKEPEADVEHDQDNDEEKSVKKQQQHEQQSDFQEEKPVEYTFWQDSDYKDRVPLQKYEWIKEIQDKILSFKRQNVKVYIVCPGILYGCGQNTFYPLFKAAWLQEPLQLPYLEQGDNQIPTIHLKDLVKFVIKLAENPPEEGSPYLLAFDMTANKTQKSLISSISQGIGSGEVVSVNSSPLLEDEERFKLDLDIKPSKFFIGTQEQPADFEWTAKNGIKQSIKSLLKDFCDKEAHRPIKMIIFQREKDWTKDSKINLILDRFSKYYRIPVLSLTKILEYAKQHAEGQLLHDLNEEFENIMAYIKDDHQRPGLDETMKVFYRVIRWRLLQNDCTNRGYILHNYPNFRSSLEFIFNKISMKKFKRKVPKKKKVDPAQEIQIEPKQDDENQNEDNPNAQGNADTPPAQEPEPQQPEEQPQEEEQETQGPKIEPYFPETLISIKRMGVELQNMAPLIEYFIMNKIEELVYDTTGKSQNSLFESLRSHIERNGRPNNYLVNESELIKTYEQFVEKENQVSLSKKEEKIKKQTQTKVEIQTRRKNLAKQIIEIVENEGEQEIKKMPFRNYLMEFVVPTINQGLLEISNIIPNDPVDLLAEYLYLKSYDV